MKVNIKLQALFFVFQILWCLSYEVTVTRIGSVFCQSGWECLIAGKFKLDTVFMKKLLEVEQISSSFDMTFPSSIRLTL